MGTMSSGSDKTTLLVEAESTETESGVFAAPSVPGSVDCGHGKVRPRLAGPNLTSPDPANLIWCLFELAFHHSDRQALLQQTALTLYQVFLCQKWPLSIELHDYVSEFLNRNQTKASHDLKQALPDGTYQRPECNRAGRYAGGADGRRADAAARTAPAQ
jgi:hypothetical protein